MPNDGPTVRGLLAAKCRHEALAGFWTARSVELGLSSDGGIAAQHEATEHGRRAERLAVTALDIACRIAKAENAKRPESAHGALVEALAEPASEEPKKQP